MNINSIRNQGDLSEIKAIAFDADDTLWENEMLFRNAEGRFCELLKDFMDADTCNRLLFDMEMKNLPLYGYGIKPFILSLIEAALEFSEGNVPNRVIEQLIQLGKEMLEAPLVLIDGIEETLQQLTKKYRLVMATKGDLLDQERKLLKSGLEPFFHHIEIVSDKTPKQYLKLIHHLDLQPHEFLMVGNSIKSDILPVLEVGAYGFHIPFHTTWVHEMVNEPVEHPKFRLLEHSKEMLDML